MDDVGLKEFRTATAFAIALDFVLFVQLICRSGINDPSIHDWSSGWRLTSGKKSRTFHYDEIIISMTANEKHVFAFKNHQPHSKKKKRKKKRERDTLCDSIPAWLTVVNMCLE